MRASLWRRLNAGRDHRWARAEMSAYVEGELSSRQQRRLGQHQELCPECRRLLRTLQVLLTALPSLRLPPEAGFEVAERTAERVRAQIEEWS